MARHPWHRLWRQMCSGRLPSYRVLVPDSVTDSVQRVWEARGYDFPASRQGSTVVRHLSAPAESRNLFKSSMYFRGLTGGGIVTTGAVGAGTLGISALVGDLFTAGAVTTGVLAAATGVTGAVTGRRYLKDPKRLSKKDRASARSARWITPQSLGFVPGIKNGQDTDEQRLFHLAVTLATRIASTRAWTHPVLADHVARVDLDETVASVGVRLIELVQVRVELDAMRDGTEAARVNAYLTRLAEAFESVADRVMAMHEYLEHLRALDEQLIALDHSERTREMGERVLDIVSRTAGDDTIGAQFRDLNLEAESHAESIARLLADLDHTAEEFDDLDAQIQRAQEAGGGAGSAASAAGADRPGAAQGADGAASQAALTAEADPAARIEHYLDEKREHRGEPR